MANTLLIEITERNPCIINRSVERHSFTAEYIQRLIAGDKDVERHFTSYFGDLLNAKLRSRLRSPQLAEEVKQETFLRVLQTLHQENALEHPGALGSFVNSVCNNVLFEVFRTESKTTSALADYESRERDAETSLISDQERVEVREVIYGLPEKDRVILQSLFFDEQDKDEICRRLSVTRDYLRVLLQRAKARFRSNYLKEPASGPPTDRAKTNAAAGPKGG